MTGMLPWMRPRSMFIAVLVILPLLAFGPSALQNEFVSLDDTLLITENAAVQEMNPRSIAYVFTSYDPELYVPFTLLTYQVEHAIAGLNPVIFHFTNLVLHIASAVILFLLGRRIFKSDLPAFFVALLFAMHPLNVEAVAWAAARKDVLSTFFFLLSLYFYEREQKQWSIVSFAAALLSKVTVLTLPLVLILMDWRAGRPINKKTLLEKWPWFALSLAFSIIAIFGKTKNLGSITLIEYMLIGFKSIGWYLSKMFLPLNLSVAYPQETAVIITSIEFLLPLFVVLLLICSALIFRRHRTFTFGVLFFLITVSANFFNVWKNGMLFFASDRYAYIAAIGIFIAVASIIFSYVKPKAGLIISVVLAAVLTPLSFLQASVWQSSETLYRHSLSVAPRSLMILNNLGDVLVRSDREEEGLQLFLQGAEIDPTNVLALTNAGNLYKKRGDLNKAEEFYRKAAHAAPENPRIEQLMGLYLLGELYLEQGKMDEGFAALKRATELGNEYAEPFFNYALMLERNARLTEAMDMFSKAVEADGTYLAARYRLAGLLAERGQLEEARTQLQAIVDQNPNYEKAAEHLAKIRALVAQ